MKLSIRSEFFQKNFKYMFQMRLVCSLRASRVCAFFSMTTPFINVKTFGILTYKRVLILTKIQEKQLIILKYHKWYIDSICVTKSTQSLELRLSAILLKQLTSFSLTIFFFFYIPFNIFNLIVKIGSCFSQPSIFLVRYCT